MKATAQEMFKHYKARLESEASDDRKTRFNVIQYLCSFPKIDPYKMAAAITRDGYSVEYDDTSISEQQNRHHRAMVGKLLA